MYSKSERSWPWLCLVFSPLGARLFSLQVLKHFVDVLIEERVDSLDSVKPGFVAVQKEQLGHLEPDPKACHNCYHILGNAEPFGVVLGV
jgi:hypothetical protein